MSKDELLERVDLILQRHEIRYRLVTFIRVVYASKCDIFLIVEHTVEISVILVEAEFGEQ